MARTGCKCGAGLWNGYIPGGVNWDIFPMKYFKDVAYSNPMLDLYEVQDLVSEKYYNGNFHDLWFCRRCKRVQIWKIDGMYVAYEPIDFDTSIDINEVLQMEEWIAINDWDYEEEYTGVYVLENCPFRPYRYFLSEDKKHFYVINSNDNSIEYVYEEYYRQIEDNFFRDRKGFLKYEYKNNVYVGSFYEDGSKEEIEDRNYLLSDAVYGFVIGDALGVPYEFMERDSFKCEGMDGYGSHNQPPGTWSDDSSLMLATCKSLKENNLKINIDDMKKRFNDWLNYGEYTANGDVFDVGHATRKALMTGIPQSSEFSNGNGSLMRILPLAFIDCSDEDVRAVSGITHDHWIAKEACVIYVNIIKEYLSQKSTSVMERKSIIDIIRKLPKLDPPFDRLYKLEQLGRNDIKSSGYVVDTLEAAFWCMLQSGKVEHSSYKDCLLRAVNLGDDTDTVSAVTGALAGLYYSFHSLPDDWIWKIKNNKLIQDCLW